MSTRRAPTAKRAKRPAKNSRPASSSREANARWGFCDRAKTLPAFTAEHLAADVAAGVIANAAELGALMGRNCPRTRAEDCRPGDVPLHYRSTRTSVLVDDAGERPRRWSAQERSLCFDCRTYQWWRERREFTEDFGDDRDGFGYARGRTISDAGDVDRAFARQHQADGQLIAGVAQLDEPLDWHDARLLAASVRRYLAAWAAVTARPL